MPSSPLVDSINWSEIGLLGSIILGGLLFFYLFLKNYLEQKGKNYADKKDISEITKRVEEVKNEYAKTLALINANLSLASKGIETFESEQFKSYIAFHQACSYVLNDVSNIDVGTFRIKLDFSVSTEKEIELIKEAFAPLRKAKANHDLFNDNDEIKIKADELYTSCFQYSSTLYNLISAVSILQITRKHLVDVKKEINTEDQREDYAHIEEIHRESKRDLIKAKHDVVKYIDGDEFHAAIKLNTEYEILLREYLKVARMKIIHSDTKY